MRRLLFAFALTIIVGTRAIASDVVTYESITVSTTAVGIATATLDPPGRGQMTQCEFRLAGAQIRFRYDGTAPTASEGTPLEVGDVWTSDSHADAQAARFIRTGATDGTLKGHCWR